jgi:hypothetical protein
MKLRYSVQRAISYVRSKAKELNIDESELA